MEKRKSKALVTAAVPVILHIHSASDSTHSASQCQSHHSASDSTYLKKYKSGIGVAMGQLRAPPSTVIEGLNFSP